MKRIDYQGLVAWLVVLISIINSNVLHSQPIVKSNIQDDRVLFSEASLNLYWTSAKSYQLTDLSVIKQVYFEGAETLPVSHLPIFSRSGEVPVGATGVKVKNFVFSESRISEEETGLLKSQEISTEYRWITRVGTSFGKQYGYISMIPLRKEGDNYFRIEKLEYDLEFTYTGLSRGSRDAHSWKENSILSSGDWLKLMTGEDGVYKISTAFLTNLGFDINGITSNQIRLYGTPAGMLDANNSVAKPDDLQELPIYIEDGGDGIFNKGDYILFYGEGQDVWRWNTARFVHDRNVYTDSNAYFFTINSGEGQPKRIGAKDYSDAVSTITTSSYTYLDFHEVDEVNLIKSGREWYGEKMGVVPSYDFGFSVPNVVSSEKAQVYATVAARSVGVSGTKASLSMSNQSVDPDEETFSSAPLGYATRYAWQKGLKLDFLPRNSDFLTKIEYDNSLNPQASAWVNEIEVVARRELVFLDPIMKFRDERVSGSGNVTEFLLNSDNPEMRVWNVTDISSISEMSLIGNGQNAYTFKHPTDSLETFLAFNPSRTLTPSVRGFVENQNLHAHRNFDYVIISHPQFISHSQRLADFHAQNDGFTPVIITPQQIYNEFSGGVQDITGIKEYMRMLYKRAIQENGISPRYLLLFGDASYDYKNRISGNSNYIPSFQTSNSLVPTLSIISDDFYGALDDDEGDSSVDLVDLGIGRLPARTKAEADNMVNKTLAYASSESFGDWRNWVSFVADDLEEKSGNPTVFMKDSDQLDAIISDSAERINVEKLFMDAFPQVSGSGGQRYPEGAKAISDRIEKGALMMYYIGHGGELGWAHERVLDVATINKWDNNPKLPVFVTATCEFTRFDDPRRTSAGEYVMLNPDGGGVALLTTTRAVYGTPNLTLTTQFTKSAFSSIASGQQRLGDLNRITKVRSLTVGDTASENDLIANNTRCFTLLGDPALRLAYPQFDVVITDMPDTIKALDKVTVTGRVAYKDGTTIEDFNGLVIPVVFDKVSELRTLNNEDRVAYNYEERRNILFRGKVRAQNGEFQFEFIVPKDINKAFGNGKLSLYAYDETRDAGGAYFDYIIGGLSENPIEDNEGPQVDLFMNNNQFVFGGLTDEDPDLYAEIYDLTGVNMVGNGVGHDITAVLDDNSSNTLVLNDYYEADENSYQTGKIVYPFNDLDEGLHQLKLQVWDVNNNPTDAFTEFVVANSEEIALQHVLNYPNPFTTNTDFYFEHNKPGQTLDVSVDVFTVSGKLVKSIGGNYFSEGYRVGPINWNGLDEFGDDIGTGVYMYKIKVKTAQGQTAEQYERLVILN